MDSLSLHLSLNIFILPSYFKANFPRHRILIDGVFFSVITLKMLFHCLLVSIIPDKNLVVIFIVGSLSVIFFSTCFSLHLWFITVWLQCAQVWFSLDTVCLGFAELFSFIHMSFIMLGKFGPLCLQLFLCLIFFLLSFWDSNYMYVRPFDIVPLISECLFIFVLSSSD